MSAILLRKLTEKSVIQQGKNQGLTVGEVMKKCKLDIIYAYFNYANLTFMDDILDSVRISPEDRIEKPGKAPEKYEFYKKRNLFHSAIGVLGDKNADAGVIKAVSNKIAIAKRRAFRKAESARFRFEFKKSKLQFKNHGHK